MCHCVASFGRRPLALAVLLFWTGVAAAQPVAVEKFFGSTTDRFDHFGSATAMDGDLMLVGAWGETDPPPPFYVGGRLFVFRYTGDGPWIGWEEEARLIPAPELINQDLLYGEAAALLRGAARVPAFAPGETFAIGGAPYETIGEPLPDNFWHGAAYVHRRDATGAWVFDGRLVPDGVETEDHTGGAVALSADTTGRVWAAAWSDRYYVVWRQEGAQAWVEEQRLDAGGFAFGFGSTRLSGSVPGPLGPSALFVGAAGGGTVRVWRHEEGAPEPWQEEAVLVGSADGPGDVFGASVALDGDLLVVGSEHVPPGPDPPGGRAYVFRYTGTGPFGGWEEEAVLEPSVPRSHFGQYVSVEADSGGAAGADVVVMHSGTPGLGTVALHLFRRDAATGQWREAPPVVGSEVGLTGYVRGTAVSFAVAGDEFDDARGTDAGAAYLVDLRGLGVTAEPGPVGPEPISLTVHPNPAQGRAALVLTLPAPGPVSVALYDGLGRRAALVHEGVLAAGAHRLPFDVSGLPAGVCLARAETGGGILTARLAVVR